MIVKVSVGSVVFDLERSEFVPGVEIPGSPICFDQDGKLLMFRPSGLMNWDFQWDESTNRLRIAWDEKVVSFGSNYPWARSTDGTSYAIARESEGAVLGHIEEKHFVIDRVFRPQQEVRYSVLSPDGRFLATGSHGVLESEAPTLKVWNVDSGECLLQQRRHSIAWPQFSTDGRWLFVSDPIVRILRVGTWEEIETPNVHFRHICFSRNGKFVVNSTENGYIQLIKSEDLSIVANLAIPFSESVVPLYLSDEADRLVVRTRTGERFASIDLRRIHDQLVQVNPQWAFLDTPAGTTRKTITNTAEVTFDAGAIGPDWRYRRQQSTVLAAQAESLWESGSCGKALQCLSEAVELDPANSEIAQLLAWYSIGGPADLRSPTRAIQVIRKLAEREHDDTMYASPLAFAYLQNGEYSMAIAVLDRAETQRSYVFDAFDGYCKASCLLRLGKKDEAHFHFKQAEAWHLENASTLDSRQRDALRYFLQAWESALESVKEP